MTDKTTETLTVRCPECDCPNGWHKLPCKTGERALLKEAAEDMHSEH